VRRLSNVSVIPNCRRGRGFFSSSSSTVSTASRPKRSTPNGTVSYVPLSFIESISQCCDIDHCPDCGSRMETYKAGELPPTSPCLICLRNRTLYFPENLVMLSDVSCGVIDESGDHFETIEYISSKRILCSHGKQQYSCRQCRGGIFCIHFRRKALCNICKGNRFEFCFIDLVCAVMESTVTAV
jgi:hypothetical protein